MINLLPPKEKEELLLQKYKRLVVVLGNMVLISVVCLTLILFALKFYVLSEISFQKLNLDLANQKYTTDGTMTFKEMIKKYNASLVKMDAFYKQTTYMSDILKNVLGVNRAPGIYFKDISINRLRKDSTSPGSDEVKISITGYSSTRESLILFKEALEKNDKIKNISFPPQNWVKDSDIDFEVKFEKK
jgi:hypothetical protein